MNIINKEIIGERELNSKRITLERATHDLGKNIKVEGKIFSKCILKTVRHTLVTTGKSHYSW